MSDNVEGLFKYNKRGLLSLRIKDDIFVLDKEHQEEGWYDFAPHRVTGESHKVTFYSCRDVSFII